MVVLDCGPGCKRSRTTYKLEVEREHDGVRLWTRMQREHDNILSGGGEGAWWCQCRPGCKRSKATYQLEVERERDGVGL